MKIKPVLSIIFLSVLFLFTTSKAEIGYGVSEVGTISSLTSIKNENISQMHFNLSQNYPNPFNPSTIIKLTLPKPAIVKIEVFDLLGQRIETLLNNPMPAGSHEVEFTAKNLPSGVYLYRISAGKFQQVKKMISMK